MVLWSVYSGASLTPPGVMWTLAYLTCPISLARHYAFSFQFVLLVNAATYALAGGIVETLWRQYKQTRFIPN